MLGKEVLKDVEILFRSDEFIDDIPIDNLTIHTNDIKENSCFVCIKGNKYDSHDLIHSLTNKPRLIVANRQIETDIPYVIVHDTKKSLPLICANFYQHPSKKLQLIGVTGTDGKTTTSLVIKQIIDHFSECAYIGTNGFMYHEHSLKNKLTTPVPTVLNEFLNDVIKEKIPYTSIEVSSQGLESHRVDHLHFKVAVFTNLSHEHLDHHKTMENYFLSKLKLFQMLDEESYAIINLDSKPYAERIINETRAKVITYGHDINSQFRISNIRTSLHQTLFDLTTPEGIFKDIELNLFGDYNVYNTTAALCANYALGFKIEEMIPILNTLKEIDGRMHIIDCGQPFNVIVDFAHTPNALYCLLNNLSQFKQNNLTIVFGSAGERDKAKRPIMGHVVEKYANRIILTSEDPKSEDALDIIHDISVGIEQVFQVSIIPDRKKAIVKALDDAKSGDIVVITGKGNENIEVFNGYIVEHNDIHIAEDFLNKKYHPQYIYSIANM